jgi:hypothetical protein
MRPRELAKSIGIAVLSIQILFLATGIHDLESHTPQSHATRAIAGERCSQNPNLKMLSPDGCSVCLANRILQQCLFPVIAKPAIAEYFRPCLSFIRKMEAFPASSPEINRGPPPASALLS